MAMFLHGRLCDTAIFLVNSDRVGGAVHRDNDVFVTCTAPIVYGDFLVRVEHILLDAIDRNPARGLIDQRLEDVDLIGVATTGGSACLACRLN